MSNADRESGARQPPGRPSERPPASESGDAALLLGVGLVLGLAADRLLWAGPLGPGLVIWMTLLGGTAVALARGRGWAWSGAVAGWSVVAVLAAAGTMWRASPALNLLFLGTALVAASGAILAARGIRLGESRVLDHVWGLVLVPWHAVTGAIGLVARARLPAGRGSDRALAVGRGVLLAIPAVLIFGALFASADPAFERAVDVLIPDATAVPAHVFMIGFFGWVGAGLLTGLFPGGRENPLAAFRPPKLSVEVTTALALLATLFAVFVAIQFTYLFGGASAIEGVSGLTVAEYARRGFFELVAVAGLVTMLLLAANATIGDDGRRAFRLLAGLLVGLVMVIIASAGLRLRLYIDAFGLTDARFFAAAIMAWIAVTLFLFTGTVLRDRPRRFASGALVAGLVTVLALGLLNPDAAVARTNVARAMERAPGEVVLDADYLASLSADALPVIVPAVLEHGDRMAPEARCRLADILVDRWGPGSVTEDTYDWRRWNAANARARKHLGEAVPELRAVADRCENG